MCSVGLQPCLPVLRGMDERMPGVVPGPGWQPSLVFPGERQLLWMLQTQSGVFLNKPRLEPEVG